MELLISVRMSWVERMDEVGAARVRLKMAGNREHDSAVDSIVRKDVNPAQL